MRWELLFADLEARLDAADRAAVDAEIADRTLDERAAVTLAARCAATLGGHVGMTVRGGGRARGSLVEVAGAWVLLETAEGQAVIPLAAVVEVEGLGNAVAPLSEVRRRLTLASVLRELSAEGTHLTLDTDAGMRHGWITAVGADHLDLDGPAGTVAIALTAVRLVRAA